MKADLDDADFMQGMHDLLGMDEKQVEKLIDELDASAMTDLADAVANGNREAAEQIVGQLETSDSDVNPLFRGKDLDELDDQKKKPSRVSKHYQFGIGDAVQVEADITDPKTGEVRTEMQNGTVQIPIGPEVNGKPTVGVKIEGHPRMVERDKVRKLEEGVLGMVGVPELQRMQQLAGIQPSAPPPAQEIEVETAEEAPQQCDPAAQINAAFDAIQAMLPQVRVADLKGIRQRIMTLQTSLNEGAVPREGRARKL